MPESVCTVALFGPEPKSPLAGYCVVVTVNIIIVDGEALCFDYQISEDVYTIQWHEGSRYKEL